MLFGASHRLPCRWGILAVLSVPGDTFLASGTRYRVAEPFLGFDPGDEVELVARHYDPHNAAQTWTFVRGSDARSAQLSELADAHVPYLRDLARYLRVEAPRR